MANIAFKYILEDSHTFIKLTEDGQKVKVVTGEIIEIDEKIVDRGRMFMAGFRTVSEDGEAEKNGNDASVEEAKALAKEAEKAAKKAEKEAQKKAEKEEEGTEVPQIVVPTVETTVSEDGEADITVTVTK